MREYLSIYTKFFSDGELETFIEKIVEAQNRGVTAIKNVTSESNWSFGQSLFFAGTILTTIGKDYKKNIISYRFNSKYLIM